MNVGYDKATSEHIIVKLVKIKDKEKELKMEGEIRYMTLGEATRRITTSSSKIMEVRRQ